MNTVAVVIPSNVKIDDSGINFYFTMLVGIKRHTIVFGPIPVGDMPTMDEHVEEFDRFLRKNAEMLLHRELRDGDHIQRISDMFSSAP